MENTQLTILLEKYLQGTASEPESDALLAWYRSVDHSYVEWQTSDPLEERVVFTRIFENINKKITQQPAGVYPIYLLKKAWFRYAAAIIIVLGIGAYFWMANKKTEQTFVNNKQLLTDVAPGRNRAILTLANGQRILLDSTKGNIINQGNLTVINEQGILDYEGVGTTVEFHTLSTPKGGQYKVILPDGTNVWLNAASSITYPTIFTGKNRSVAITGEAYFEVIKNVTAPFQVKVNNQQTIEVLGTRFNVSAYKEEGRFKASLAEGAIKVDNQLLVPGQAILNGKIIQTDIEQDIAWKNGIFNFNKVSLERAMYQLSQWYNIEVIYEGGIPAITFWGEMGKNLTLTEVLTSLERTGVHFRMEAGRRLVVTK